MRKNSISAPQYGVSGAGRMAGNLRATRSTVSTLDNGGFKVNRKPSLQDQRLADPRQRSPNEQRLTSVKEEGRTQHGAAQQYEEAAPPVVLDMSELYPNRGSVNLSKKKGTEKEEKRTVPRAASSLGQAWKAGGSMTRSLQASFANIEASSRQRNALLSLLLIVGYLFVGVGAYNYYFESWGMIKAIYFGIVTLTSVGYGDLAPTGQEGRLFTMFFGLTGISLVALALSQLANYIAETRDALNAQFKSVLVGQYFNKGEDAEGAEGAKPPSATKADEWKAYLQALSKALVPIFVVNFIGAGLIGYIEGTWTVLDTWYYAIITSATIGFGDLHPTKNRSCLVAIFYIPASVLAVGNGIRSMTEYQLQKDEEKKRMEVLTREFVYDDLFEMDANGDGTIDRHEFTIFMLKLWGIVDEDVIAGIGKRFEELDTDGSGALTREDFAKDGAGKKQAAAEEAGQGLSPEDQKQFVQLRDQLAGALVAAAPNTPSRRSVRLHSGVHVKAMHTPPASPRHPSVSQAPSPPLSPVPPSPQEPRSPPRLTPLPSPPPQTQTLPLPVPAPDIQVQTVPVGMEEEEVTQAPPPEPAPLTPLSDLAAALGLDWKLGF